MVGNDWEWVVPESHDGSPFSAGKSASVWYSDDWGDMVSVEMQLLDSKGRLIHPNSFGATRWDLLGIYHLEIAGESHMSAKAADALETQKPIALVPEPDNPYDKNAIRIDIDGLKLGYVPKTKTTTVRKIMNSGPVNCAVWSIHRDRSSGQPRSISGLIWRDGTITW